MKNRTALDCNRTPFFRSIGSQVTSDFQASCAEDLASLMILGTSHQTMYFVSIEANYIWVPRSVQ
jgi:hypothetical protein